METLISERVELWKQGKNPYFIHEFKHSIFVIGDHQFYKGYSLLLLKEYVRELHELDPETYIELSTELLIAGKAIHKTFNPWKMNYQCLGNKDQHVHWHIIPRYEDDKYHRTLPFTDHIKKETDLSDYLITNSEAKELVAKIRPNIHKIIQEL
jgi:diadenosine tetraphosphate (Ap4A) HIT family hydrolase